MAGTRGELTVRESQVAELVACGLSNREIGARLFISKRTVDAHLNHIFTKIGVSSRVNLAVMLRAQIPRPQIPRPRLGEAPGGTPEAGAPAARGRNVDE